MARIVIEDLTPPVQEYEKNQMKSILGGVIGPLGVVGPLGIIGPLGIVGPLGIIGPLGKNDSVMWDDLVE